MNSYRPVNILNAIAKILDTIVANQIKAFLDRYSLIPYNNNDGLKGLSTTITVLVLLNLWSKLLESNQNSVVLQLDQSAAYEMVNHAILIDKLKILGFDSNSIEWMKSYLRDRRQKVEVNGKTSTIKILGSNSTTQGTVLAGILYLLYTLDFPVFSIIK